MNPPALRLKIIKKKDKMKRKVGIKPPALPNAKPKASTFKARPGLFFYFKRSKITQGKYKSPNKKLLLNVWALVFAFPKLEPQEMKNRT